MSTQSLRTLYQRSPRSAQAFMTPSARKAGFFVSTAQSPGVNDPERHGEWRRHSERPLPTQNGQLGLANADEPRRKTASLSRFSEI
jgi:hypothetical protein